MLANHQGEEETEDHDLSTQKIILHTFLEIVRRKEDYMYLKKAVDFVNYQIYEE